MAQPDPPRIIPLAVELSGIGAGGVGGASLRPANPDDEAGALPWFGPVCAAALVPPPGRPETSAAAVVLSEGGQLHVHDVRGFLAGRGGQVRAVHPPETPEVPAIGFVGGQVRALNQILTSGGDTQPISGDGVGAGSEEGGGSAPCASSPVLLPVAELVDPLPRLDPDCAPAVTAASSELLDFFVAAAIDAEKDRHQQWSESTKRSPRDAWGSMWPVSGGKGAASVASSTHRLVSAVLAARERRRAPHPKP